MSIWQYRSDRLTASVETPPRYQTGERVTVFLFPGLSGIVEEFATLLAPIEAPFHFVPIRYRHWSELEREPVEFDRLVADCVRQIESHGPPATLLLVGYSFGGLMAWAVARVMEASGHRIGLLGLIDALACPRIERSAESIIGRFGRVVRGIRRGETGEQLARSFAGILFRSRASVRTMFRRVHGFPALTRILNSIDANVQIRYHIILITECMARLANCGERFHYPSVVFRSSARSGEDADLGWARYLANLRTVTLSGNHDNVMQKQNVKQIILHLTATISEEKEFCPVRKVTCT
jgi:thioesterase domain-containing protein